MREIFGMSGIGRRNRRVPCRTIQTSNTGPYASPTSVTANVIHAPTRNAGNAASTSPAPASATTTKPAATFTSAMITDEPVAASGDAPASFASTAIAPIAHTFPGTYLPRLDTNQMRAASSTGSGLFHVRSSSLHDAISTA